MTVSKTLASPKEITLKEYFEMRLEEMSNSLTARFDAAEKALLLQAAEYSRRLDDLNHVHQQAVETQFTFVPREMYDQYQKALESKLDAFILKANDDLGVLRAQIAKVQSDSIPREMYDQYHKALTDSVNQKIDEINKKGLELTIQLTSLTGRAVGVGVAVTVFLAVMQIVIHFWMIK